MMQMPLPLARELVLIGGGHAHALVLRMLGMKPVAGLRITVIDPTPTPAYSGMLPGFVAGHYSAQELELDIFRLARFADARVILGAATGIDRENRQIHVQGRPPIRYDVASIDIGITSEMSEIPGFSEHAIPAKPLGRFAAAWDNYRANAPAKKDKNGPLIIGGGVAGLELAMAMAHAVPTRTVRVLDRSKAASHLFEKTREIILEKCSSLGVEIHENAEIDHITSDGVVLADGQSLVSDFIVGAAGAYPYPWLAQTGLKLTDGFIDINENLQTSDNNIFSAGDCAHMVFAPRPKAGVYAVRAAPILHANLRAILTGKKLKEFKPQSDYLKLISLGSTSAVAEKYGRSIAGNALWRLKDRIDRRFMARLSELPKMKQPALPAQHVLGLREAIGPKPLCGGCGAKVASNTLSRSLERFEKSSRADVLSGIGDDAAVLQIGGQKQVISTDHLRSFTNDPWQMTRITAVHALGDVWAMGAAPQAALAMITLPRMTPEMQQGWLDEIMSAATEVFTETGAEIVGGHSAMGAELTIGFTVTGLCENPISLAGAKPGDNLILTKPIGSGVILAAEMQGIARGKWVAQALGEMARPQGKAASSLSTANAMTDVTGFGLAGHLLEICSSSAVAAHIRLGDIPYYDGAIEMAAEGVRSTIFESNKGAATQMTLPGGPKSDLLFDPQTAGGLLAAVPPPLADAILTELKRAGFVAACIGEITQGSPHILVSDD